jgi:peptide/nickel transport system substrate-binding protein
LTSNKSHLIETHARQGELPDNAPSPTEGHTRRQVLRASITGAAGLGVASLLAAPAADAAAAKPKRGGTLTAAVTGGSSIDTVDPKFPQTQADYARLRGLYNSLVEFGADALPQLTLAEELSPNADATEWTIRVKKGIKFHNGKELTAADVMYTLNRIAYKSQGEGAGEIVALNLPATKKVDKYTVKIPCHTPFATLDGVLAGYYFNIVPEGFNPKKPVGTGPYRFESFTPGVRSYFSRNPDYWENGLPYTDGLEIVDYADETSQTNALLSGQANLANDLTADQIAVLQSNGKKYVISPGGGSTPFTMRCDQSPWTDNRVRLAMKLIVDRTQMLELLFAGHGTVGNDLFGIWDPSYDHSIPQRHQDIEQAKSLLKAAGHSNLTVTMNTGNIAQGTLKSAQIFAQQAAAAGVKINIQQVTPTVLYGPRWLKWNFAQDFWNWYPYLVQAAQTQAPTAQFNETHFKNARYSKLFAEAVGTVDLAKRTELVHELQKIDWEYGGYITPYFPPVIDGYAPNVNGVVSSKVGLPFNDWALKTFWIS